MSHPAVRFWRYMFLTPILGGVGVFILWALGLISFIVTVMVMAPAPDSHKADGIVVLTGGMDRVRTGLELLQKGQGHELLISGVNRATDLKNLILNAHMNKSDFPCCITLGFKALDTTGNAQETNEWARRYHITHLRLVTSAYHMPRALIEMRRAMPDVKIIPHPVQSSTFDALSSQGFALMAEEYHKTLIVLARALLAGARDFQKGPSP